MNYYCLWVLFLFFSPSLSISSSNSEQTLKIKYFWLITISSSYHYYSSFSYYHYYSISSSYSITTTTTPPIRPYRETLLHSTMCAQEWSQIDCRKGRTKSTMWGRERTGVTLHLAWGSGNGGGNDGGGGSSGDGGGGGSSNGGGGDGDGGYGNGGDDDDVRKVMRFLSVAQLNVTVVAQSNDTMGNRESNLLKPSQPSQTSKPTCRGVMRRRGQTEASRVTSARD